MIHTLEEKLQGVRRKLNGLFKMLVQAEVAQLVKIEGDEATKEDGNWVPVIENGEKSSRYR